MYTISVCVYIWEGRFLVTIASLVLLALSQEVLSAVFCGFTRAQYKLSANIFTTAVQYVHSFGTEQWSYSLKTLCWKTQGDSILTFNTHFTNAGTEVQGSNTNTDQPDDISRGPWWASEWFGSSDAFWWCFEGSTSFSHLQTTQHWQWSSFGHPSQVSIPSFDIKSHKKVFNLTSRLCSFGLIKLFLKVSIVSDNVLWSQAWNLQNADLSSQLALMPYLAYNVWEPSFFKYISLRHAWQMSFSSICLYCLQFFVMVLSTKQIAQHVGREPKVSSLNDNDSLHHISLKCLYLQVKTINWGINSCTKSAKSLDRTCRAEW